MKADYSSVTETWGLPASPEQLAMQYCRYRMAAKLSEGRKVLELGCGSAMGLPYLSQRSALAVGGDYTMGLLREARQHLPGAGLVQMDAQRLPFPDACIDVVLMLEMIYYIPDQEAAFEECRRVLKPDGVLMVSVPNPGRPDFNPSPLSTRYPNLADLAGLFKRHGFTPRLYGGFPVEPNSSRDRILAQLRHIAVQYRLIPGSMRAKSFIKRLLYGPLPRLGAVHDGMAGYADPIELDGTLSQTAEFKTMYGVGRIES